MKAMIGIVGVVLSMMFSLSLVFANPAMLPKHEGYPMKNDGSPVTGQPTANDPGQASAGGEKALTKAADLEKHSEQHLKNADNERVMQTQGAGQLPKVQGPQIKIEPPVTSATKIGSDRVIK